MSAIEILTSIAPLRSSADVWFLDIWGVLHNGVRPYAGAVQACAAFRAQGGRVILVSNSPRPREGVIRQLDGIGVPRDAYDAAVTSGDVSRTLIAAHAGQPVFHLGPERDLAVYQGTGAEPCSDPACGTVVVCTGLFDDDTETPEDYRVLLRGFKARALDMICVNPDVQVERGARIIYCAGALAQAYAELGGRVLYAGKPHAPIYDAALEMARTMVAGVERARILAIGDGVKTDIAGASGAGIRSVYIASPVHIARGLKLEAALGEIFAGATVRPVAAMTALAW